MQTDIQDFHDSHQDYQDSHQDSQESHQETQNNQDSYQDGNLRSHMKRNMVIFGHLWSLLI